MSAPVRKRSLRKKLLVAGGSLALSFAAAEIVVRAKYGAPLAERLPILEIQANRYRGWEMVPGKAHYTYEHRVEVNSLGLRGAELADKAPGEVRVLALGDSLVYGQGVGDDETLPFLLERELDARAPEGTDFTVVNGGLRAYDTRQEMGLLDELGETIAPDIVILFWFKNDVDERDIEGTFERLSKSGPIAFDLGRPATGWTAWKWRAKQLVRRSALAMRVYDTIKVDQVGQVDAAAIATGLERLDGYLARLVAKGEEQGFVPLLAIVPLAGLAREAAPDRGPVPDVLALAAEHGVATLDLLPAIRAELERSGRLPVVPYDGHFDAAGNGAMAREVAKSLLEM